MSKIQTFFSLNRNGIWICLNPNICSTAQLNSVLTYLETLNKDLFQNVEGFVDLTKAEQDAKAYIAAKKLADEETDSFLKTDLIEKQEDAAVIFANNLCQKLTESKYFNKSLEI